MGHPATTPIPGMGGPWGPRDLNLASEPWPHVPNPVPASEGKKATHLRVQAVHAALDLG